MEQMIIQMESVDVTTHYKRLTQDVSKLSPSEYKTYRKRLRWNLRKNLLNKKHPKWTLEKEQDIFIYYDPKIEGELK